MTIRSGLQILYRFEDTSFNEGCPNEAESKNL